MWHFFPSKRSSISFHWQDWEFQEWLVPECRAWLSLHFVFCRSTDHRIRAGKIRWRILRRRSSSGCRESAVGPTGRSSRFAAVRSSSCLAAQRWKNRYFRLTKIEIRVLDLRGRAVAEPASTSRQVAGRSELTGSSGKSFRWEESVTSLVAAEVGGPRLSEQVLPEQERSEDRSEPTMTMLTMSTSSSGWGSCFRCRSIAPPARSGDVSWCVLEVGGSRWRMTRSFGSGKVARRNVGRGVGRASFCGGTGCCKCCSWTASRFCGPEKENNCIKNFSITAFLKCFLVT